MELDAELAKDDFVPYHLPLHMGGTKKSRRLRCKTLIQQYENEVAECEKSLQRLISEFGGPQEQKITPVVPPAPVSPDPPAHPQPVPPQQNLTAAAANLLPRTQLQLQLQYNDAPPSRIWSLIQFVFHLLGSPAESIDGQSCWEGAGGVINTIRDYLFLGRGWRRRRTVRRVLEYVRSQLDAGVSPKQIDAATMKRKGQGRKRKLDDAMNRCVAKSLNKGFGMQLTASIINQKLTNEGSQKVHISTVYRSARKVFGGSCHNRTLKKTGNKDVDSVWCRARLAFALQLSQQFREDVEGPSMIGKRVVRIFLDDDDGTDKPFFGKIISYDVDKKYYKVRYDDGDEEELAWSELRHPLWPIIARLAVLWCDEKHKKIVIGPNNRHEWLFHVDPNDPDRYLSPKDGGVQQQPRASTRAKYMKECRGLFAVMAKQLADGTCVGRRMEPFNYTGMKVVGPVAFEKRVQAEIRRVSNLKTTGTTRSKYWKDVGEGLPGGPYEARYGDTWRQEVVERLGKGGDAVCNVCDLMDHTIAQGNLMFADTPFADSWVIYHDALSSWWSVGAQEYMETKGFKHRQIKSLDFTNAGTRYENGLPGDTPEYMPLDSNLFSDLELMVRWNVSATNELPRGHPDKFDLTTPTSAWDAVSRTWKHAPTSDRIVEDINRVFNAIEEVIKERGAAVDFGKLRHGRRLREHIRSHRRSKIHSEKKCFDELEGLHPVSKRIIIDLCNL